MTSRGFDRGRPKVGQPHRRNRAVPAQGEEGQRYPQQRKEGGSGLGPPLREPEPLAALGHQPANNTNVVVGT
jgi:hypothetical protein